MSIFKPDVIAVMGRTGMGKSTLVKNLLSSQRKPMQLIIDSMSEYRCARTTLSAAKLIEFLKAGWPEMSFRPSVDERIRLLQFYLVCKAAYGFGHLTIAVEELRLYTKPTQAPYWWATLTTQGRHRNISVIGTSQRPSHIDKDFLGNATEVYTFGLRYPADAKAVADAMPSVSADEILSLQPYHYLHLDASGNVRRGKTLKK